MIHGLGGAVALDDFCALRFGFDMTPRDLVTRRIAARASRFPHFELTQLETGSLDRRDAALARAIDHAVSRHWLTLSAVLDSRLNQPWEGLQAELQAVLLVGAAQLLLLERVPDHAVINEAVQWTKTNVRQKAGGLVNAVLRRVAGLRREVITLEDVAAELPRNVLPLHDGRAWVLGEDVFDTDPAKRLAQQTSHNYELIGHWMRHHGREGTRRLAMHSLVQGPIIVTGLDERRLGADEEKLELHDTPGFWVYTGAREGLDGLLAGHAFGRVQDPGTAMAVTLTGGLKPRLIVDYCAGRGTKTMQLAQLHPEARIVATDVDAARFAVLRETFAGHERVEVVPFGGIGRYRGQADLLVLDVPCSNTGVLGRRVEAKYRFTARSLEAVCGVQRQIIADALSLLGSNGRLLYSTCSVEQEENAQQARWIEQWHPLRIVDEVQRLPRGLPGDSLGSYADGGYAALLEGSDGVTK